MTFRALLLIGGALLAAPVQAQSAGDNPPSFPKAFFAPNSLAGPMLRPLRASGEKGQAAGLANAYAPASQSLAQVESLHRLQQEAVRQPNTGKTPDKAAEAAAAPQAAAGKPQVTPASLPPANTTTSVRIIVENVKSASGMVNVAVCDTGLSVEGCPYHTEVRATIGFVEATINNIPPGNYAVVGYQDINNNNTFDKFLGMPREPYALSGAAGKELIPSFHDAIVKMKPGENYVVIRLKRLGSG